MLHISGCLRAFIGSESGAVTVDWVVLTAAVVGLGVGVVGILISGTAPLGESIETSLVDGGNSLDLSFD